MFGAHHVAGHGVGAVVLVSDWTGIAGYEACRRIREQPANAAAYMVAVTGWGQDEDRRRSQEAGFDLHLTKPVDPPSLESLLARLTPPALARS